MVRKEGSSQLCGVLAADTAISRSITGSTERVGTDVVRVKSMPPSEGMHDQMPRRLGDAAKRRVGLVGISPSRFQYCQGRLLAKQASVKDIRFKTQKGSSVLGKQRDISDRSSRPEVDLFSDHPCSRCDPLTEPAS